MTKEYDEERKTRSKRAEIEENLLENSSLAATTGRSGTRSHRGCSSAISVVAGKSIDLSNQKNSSNSN